MTSSTSQDQARRAIAQNMQRLRHSTGLSLDALAARANLAKGTLVAVERGEANPSIGVLCKLAAAFDVSLANLLEEKTDNDLKTKIENFTPQTLWASDTGGEAVLNAAVAGAGMFELWTWRLAPGEMFTSDPHRAGTLELIHLFRGQLEIAVGEEVLNLGEGESARLQTDEPHHYRAGRASGAAFTMAVLEGWTAAPKP